MMNTTSIRMDAGLKAQLSEVLDALGINFNTFVVMAAKQAVYQQQLPFDTKVPPHLSQITQKEMIRTLAIESGLIDDDSQTIQDWKAYRKQVESSNDE